MIMSDENLIVGFKIRKSRSTVSLFHPPQRKRHQTERLSASEMIILHCVHQHLHPCQSKLVWSQLHESGPLEFQSCPLITELIVKQQVFFRLKRFWWGLWFFRLCWKWVDDAPEHHMTHTVVQLMQCRVPKNWTREEKVEQEARNTHLWLSPCSAGVATSSPTLSISVTAPQQVWHMYCNGHWRLSWFRLDENISGAVHKNSPSYLPPLPPIHSSHIVSSSMV